MDSLIYCSNVADFRLDHSFLVPTTGKRCPDWLVWKTRRLPRCHLVHLSSDRSDYNRGGSGHELEDEMAAQEDAQRDAEEALAEGDERPSGGQSFTQRAIGDATYDAGNQGTLSEEFAEKEG